MNRNFEPQNPTIAIVGGGFSGAMLAVNLIKTLPANSHHSLTLIDRTGRFSTGVAYSTNDPYHFLNVRTLRMGAFAGDPEHFFRWLQNNKNKWQKLFPDVLVPPTGFVPRRVYALYLQAIFEEAQQEAKTKKIDFQCITAEAVDAVPLENGHLNINLNDGSMLLARSLILATGIATVQCFETDPELPPESYIGNIWEPPAKSVLDYPDLKHFDHKTRVIIIGSGLTMVDAALSLIEKGYQGEIISISNHKAFAEPQLEDHGPFLGPPFDVADFPNTALGLFRSIRDKIKIAQTQGFDWRDVIDALRPITVKLWERLPLKEKKSFMRHLISRWNKCRHRTPTLSDRILKNYQAQGKLRLQLGHVTAIRKNETNDRLIVITPDPIEADYVLNCSGLQLNIDKMQNKLLCNLLERKMINPDPLHLGLSVDAHYRVINKRNLPIYAMGLLLFGQKLETTAVPELREQCAHIAKEIALGYNVVRGKSHLTERSEYDSKSTT